MPGIGAGAAGAAGAGGEGEGFFTGLFAGLLPHDKTLLQQNLVRGLLVSVILALDYCLMVPKPESPTLNTKH